MRNALLSILAVAIVLIALAPVLFLVVGRADARHEQARDGLVRGHDRVQQDDSARDAAEAIRADRSASEAIEGRVLPLERVPTSREVIEDHRKADEDRIKAESLRPVAGRGAESLLWLPV